MNEHAHYAVKQEVCQCIVMNINRKNELYSSDNSSKHHYIYHQMIE